MFLLFTGSNYYPSGGWEDFHGRYDTKEAAIEAAANTNCDWWHVVSEDKIVASGKRGY